MSLAFKWKLAVIGSSCVGPEWVCSKEHRATAGRSWWKGWLKTSHTYCNGAFEWLFGCVLWKCLPFVTQTLVRSLYVWWLLLWLVVGLFMINVSGRIAVELKYRMVQCVLACL